MLLLCYAVHKDRDNQRRERQSMTTRPPAHKLSYTDQEAIDFHARGKPGKLEISATKPLATQRDLSLAYSPGVAVPVRALADAPERAYELTAKGNLVAIVSNGTAILGLGNLGAQAAKPVMEGKAVLFKRFADIDAFDLEIDADEVDEFVAAVRHLSPTFGGINLEDIRAPDCFVIEERLRQVMDVPVFHDDQHGTAIIVAAGFINAIEITGRKLADVKLVCNGAGAAAIASLRLLVAMGLPRQNITLCDSKGVVYTGRDKGMNQWKEEFATPTKARKLSDVIAGADVFFGLSVKGALKPDMVAAMADKPIIFAMANPDPEIVPEDVARIRDDAIMATGRSDYANQINNVLGFPYIFRGALDARASEINDDMKIAAARALAELAREEVPDEVAAAYHGRRLRFGPEYLIPSPFDPRLISVVPPAVAEAAAKSGVARRKITDLEAYGDRLAARLNPISGSLQTIMDGVRGKGRRIVFAEGEEDRVIRAANSFATRGLGKAILIGREDRVKERMAASGVELHRDVDILNARLSERNADYASFLYERQQRHGYLFRDCQRLVNQDRNVFAACMVATGDADGMVTGVTRNYSTAYHNIRMAIDPRPGHRPVGVSVIIAQGRTVFIADTWVTELPDSEDLADIAEEAAGVARRFGHTPRVAMLSYSTFGQPLGERARKSRDAVTELDRRNVDFEYDGEMDADVALSPQAMALYPFCRLSAPANVLIMPAAHSASISTRMLGQMGGARVIGPLVVGLDRSVQIANMSARASDLVNLAAIAAYDINA